MVLLTDYTKILASRILTKLKKNEELSSLETLRFSLTGPGVNIGDRLFLLYIFDHLARNRIPIVLSQGDSLTEKLFRLILPDATFVTDHGSQRLTTVCTENNYLSLSMAERSNCIVLHKNEVHSLPLAGQFYYTVFNSHYAHRDDVRWSVRLPVPACVQIHDVDKLVVCAPFTSSGQFRRTKEADAKIRAKCLDLKENHGYHVVLVGQDNDTWRYDVSDKFWDYDARGKTDLTNLCQLINCDKDLVVVSYDNCVLLLSNIFERECYFAPRRRYSKKSTLFHLQCVYGLYRKDRTQLKNLG